MDPSTIVINRRRVFPDRSADATMGRQRQAQDASPSEPRAAARESPAVQLRTAVLAFLATWGTVTTGPEVVVAAARISHEQDGLRQQCLTTICRIVEELTIDISTFVRQHALWCEAHGTFAFAASTAAAVDALKSCKERSTAASGADTPNAERNTSSIPVCGTFTAASRRHLWNGFARVHDVAVLRAMWALVVSRVNIAAHSAHHGAQLDMVGTLPAMHAFLRALFGIKSGLPRVCSWMQADIVQHLAAITAASTFAVLRTPQLVCDVPHAMLRRGLRGRGANLRHPFPIVVLMLVSECGGILADVTTADDARAATTQLEAVEDTLATTLRELLDMFEPSLWALAGSALEDHSAKQNIVLAHAVHTFECLAEMFHQYSL